MEQCIPQAGKVKPRIKNKHNGVYVERYGKILAKWDNHIENEKILAINIGNRLARETKISSWLRRWDWQFSSEFSKKEYIFRTF